MKKSDRKTTRRSFLKTSAAAGAAFSIVPGHVVGVNGQTPPSEKLNIAGIGIGGQGRGNLRQCKNENVVALCDVDQVYAKRTYDIFPDAPRYAGHKRNIGL